MADSLARLITSISEFRERVFVISLAFFSQMILEICLWRTFWWDLCHKYNVVMKKSPRDIPKIFLKCDKIWPKSDYIPNNHPACVNNHINIGKKNQCNFVTKLECFLQVYLSILARTNNGFILLHLVRSTIWFGFVPKV